VWLPVTGAWSNPVRHHCDRLGKVFGVPCPEINPNCSLAASFFNTLSGENPAELVEIHFPFPYPNSPLCCPLCSGCTALRRAVHPEVWPCRRYPAVAVPSCPLFWAMLTVNSTVFWPALRPVFAFRIGPPVDTRLACRRYTTNPPYMAKSIPTFITINLGGKVPFIIMLHTPKNCLASA
jgi:hypothetical protein